MTTTQQIYINTDVSPRKGNIMGIKPLPDGRTELKFFFRRPDGKRDAKQKTINTQNRRIVAKAWFELIASVDSSLKYKSVKECVDFYIKRKGYGGFTNACYDRLKDKLNFPVDRNLPLKFDQYVMELENELLPNKQLRSVNTVNNYKIVLRSILNFCFRNCFIDSQPIRDFRIEPFEERSRIWTSDERLSIYNTMAKYDSHLYMAVYFAEQNPIRKTDQFNLVRRNLDVSKRLIRYLPGKTSRIKKQYTVLPNVDNELLEYFLSLPPDCPYLFPRINKKGNWYHMGNPRKHWSYILDKAEVEDFHWHDLKHVAITHLINQGYSYEQLRKLGIQYSDKTARVYDERKAEDIIMQKRDHLSKFSSKVIIKNA